MAKACYQLIFWRWYGPLVTLFLLALNLLCGFIVIPDAATDTEQYRDFGAALAFPIISGVCVFFLPIVSRKAAHAILESSRLSESSIRQAEIHASRIGRVPPEAIRFAAVAGFVIALSYLALEGLLYLEDRDIFFNLQRSPIVIECIYFWFAVILLITTLVRITILLTRFATRDLRIELFQIEELVPLSNSVLWNVGALSIGLALAPIFWLGRTIPSLDIPLILAILLVTLYLFLYPIFQVRKIVLRKKKLALERIREAFKSATRSDDQQKRRLTDSAKRLEEINNLVGVRKEIDSTKEWPISIPVGMRVAFLVLVPPLSWIAASLVDWLVNQMVA